MYFNSEAIRFTKENPRAMLMLFPIQDQHSLKCFACSRKLIAAKGYFRCLEKCDYWFCEVCGNNTIETKIKCEN
jgi:hypothetical protein